MFRTNIIQSIYTRGWELVYADLTVYMSNTAGVLLEAGTDYPSRTHDFAHGFFLVVSVLLIFLVFGLSYYVSLLSEFRVVMSVTISS